MLGLGLLGCPSCLCDSPAQPTRHSKRSSPQQALDSKLPVLFQLLIVVLGTVGNLLTVYVLWGEKRKTGTAFLLVALAFADTSVLVRSLGHSRGGGGGGGGGGAGWGGQRGEEGTGGTAFLLVALAFADSSVLGSHLGRVVGRTG